MGIFTMKKRFASLYEPWYLNNLKLQHPAHDVLDVKITGSDFPVLESYQKFIHRIAESLELDVNECWAHPPKVIDITAYAYELMYIFF